MFNQLSRSFHLSARKICPNYSSHPFWLLLSKSFGWLFSRYAWIWRMSQQLGWSVWRPTGQARQRDEAAISTSKKKAVAESFAEACGELWKAMSSPSAEP